MEKTAKELSAWCRELGQFQTPQWVSLPDLDLYMDQVITYLERQTALFSEPEEKLITPAMINNYVKSGIIPRPIQKKYSREHLAYLLAISTLKQVLPIPDISGVMESLSGCGGLEALFNTMGSLQDQALQEVTQRIQEIPPLQDGTHREALGMQALRLAFEANAGIMAAKKILRLLAQEKQDLTEEKAKPAEKDKEKKIKAKVLEKEAEKTEKEVQKS